MLWWAYAGLSGSIVLSFASLALILGLPLEGVVQVTAQALVALLAAGLLVHFCAAMARRQKQQRPVSSAQALMVGPAGLRTAAKRPDAKAPLPAAANAGPGAIAALFPTQRA